MLWWIYLCLWFLLWFFSLICLQVVFLGQRICSFHSCSSSLVCLDALSSSNKPSFLMSYRFWSHQFLLSCVFTRKFDYDCSFFLNAKMSLVQIHLWQIFPKAQFLHFHCKNLVMHVTSLPSLLLWLPRAWWCFQNPVLCVHNGTESASAQSAEIKCWTDLATFLMGNS